MTDPHSSGSDEAVAEPQLEAGGAPAQSSMPVGNATLASEAPATSALPDPNDPSLVHPMRTLDLSCYFGSHKVVEGISLAFPANTVTALIGPSGCGKSTFLPAPGGKRLNFK